MKMVYKLLCLVSLGLLLSGCQKEETKVEKIAEVEFTIIENEDIPEELMTMIEEKKNHMFKITYGNDDGFYMVIGYGEQKSSGYSIQVKECYESKNAVVFDTELLGPMQDEVVEQVKTYPYIVVRIKNLNLPVVFE